MKQAINIGFGNRLIVDRIVTILHPGSAPIKRLISEAREAKRLLDASFGRKCKSVIVLDTEHVVLSAISPDTITVRIENGSNAAPE